MATLDSTTQAEYAAEVNASARAQVILDALTDPVSLKVYNSADVVVGSGTMTSPWATVSENRLLPATLNGFFAAVADTFNDGWYLKFESGSRYLRLSFGPAGSGKEAVWDLSAWTLGTRSGISGGEIVVTGNLPPVWSGAPASLTLTINSVGHDISAYASDLDDDSLTYSLGATYTGYSITPQGVLSVGTGATSRTVIVRVSDGTLSSDWSLPVTATDSTTYRWYPGHYVIPDAHLTPSGEAAYTSLWSQIAGASVSRIAGGAVTAVWGQVETAQGVYNFDAIDRQLAALAAQGRKCGINILTAKYTSGEPSTSTTPAYFPAYAITGGLVAQFGGYYQCVKYYRTNAMDRVIALFQAFANRYENDPRVAWVGTPETSLGGGIVDSDNTEANQRTQWLRLNAALAGMYVKTPCAVMNNFLWGQNSTGILTQDIVDRKLAQAGPDIFLSSTESDESWGLKYLRGQRWNGTSWVLSGPDQREMVAVIVNQEVVRYSNATPALYYNAAVSINKQTHLLWAIKGTVYQYGHYLDPAYRIPAMDGVNVLNYLQSNDLPLRTAQPPR